MKRIKIIKEVLCGNQWISKDTRVSGASAVTEENGGEDEVNIERSVEGLGGDGRRVLSVAKRTECNLDKYRGCILSVLKQLLQIKEANLC